VGLCCQAEPPQYTAREQAARLSVRMARPASESPRKSCRCHLPALCLTRSKTTNGGRGTTGTPPGPRARGTAVGLNSVVVDGTEVLGLPCFALGGHRVQLWVRLHSCSAQNGHQCGHYAARLLPVPVP
jgi:hypothetical protein